MAETSSDIIRDCASYTVEYRTRWGDDWTEIPYLYPLSCTWCAAPQIPTAILEWRYGEIMQPGTTEFTAVSRLECSDWWIRIRILTSAGTTVEWIGIVKQVDEAPTGAAVLTYRGETTRRPTGVQRMLAYGPEFLLEREPFDRAYVAQDGMERYIQRPIAFNMSNWIRPDSGTDSKRHTDLPGNRSEEIGTQQVYLFAPLLAAAGRWTIRTAVEYVLAYHTPRDADGLTTLPFRLDPERLNTMPDWGRLEYDPSGKSVWQVLCDLMDRRRGLGFCCAVVDDEVLVKPFSFSESVIDLPDGSLVPANSDQTSLDFDLAVDIDSAVVSLNTVETYDQIEVVGGPVVCCGTASALDDTIVEHWSGSQLIEYCAGASAAADYPAATERAKRDERNAIARGLEGVNRVFAYYGLPYDWGGIVKDGGESPDGNQLFPTEELGFDADTQDWCYLPELRFLPHLPLKTQHDYTGSKIADGNVTDNTPQNQAWHYRPIYCLLKLTDSSTYASKYAEVDKLADASNIEMLGATGAGREISCSVQIQPDEPGIILRVSGGQQHAIAGSDFTPLTDTGDLAAPLNWKDNLVVTFAVEADIPAVVRWPEVPAGGDTLRRLRIDASKRCGLHYVAPGTVVDCKDGVLQRTTEGGFIRDDREQMRALARLAWEWYGQPRATLSLSYRKASDLVSVGQLITSIGAEESAQTIRTVVTMRRIELASAMGDTDRTTIETQWAELDVMRLA